MNRVGKFERKNQGGGVRVNCPRLSTSRREARRVYGEVPSAALGEAGDDMRRKG